MALKDPWWMEGIDAEPCDCETSLTGGLVVAESSSMELDIIRDITKVGDFHKDTGRGTFLIKRVVWLVESLL